MRRLELLDYARFFAAIIVVLFHYTFNGIANGKIDSLEHIDSLIEFTKYGHPPVLGLLSPQLIL
jgi:peptidoglycan/LPS O-acetylase OafA/YrhL